MSSGPSTSWGTLFGHVWTTNLDLRPMRCLRHIHQERLPQIAAHSARAGARDPWVENLVMFQRKAVSEASCFPSGEPLVHAIQMQYKGRPPSSTCTGYSRQSPGTRGKQFPRAVPVSALTEQPAGTSVDFEACALLSGRRR